MVSYVHVVYVTCYFCYMFSLGPSSASTGSVQIYRSACERYTPNIYIGVYPHKYIGHEDNVQTGGVVRVRYMLFNAHLCNHIILLQSGVGLRAQFCILLEV